MAEIILKVRNVNKIYDNGVQALNDVSFDVYKGEFLSIIGLSGSGKSTLLRCINGLVQPTSGEIIYNDKDVVKMDSVELRQHRREIGMIFQHFNLIPRKSVLMNALSGALGMVPTMSSLLGRFSEQQQQQALRYLELVGLKEKADVRADELSGGQQQRVAIARTLMQNPKVLLADEPVASLDPATSHSILDYLENINKEMDKTILCNLHFLSLVRQYSTRVIALKDGQKVYEGHPKEIDEAWFKQIYGDQAKEVEIR